MYELSKQFRFDSAHRLDRDVAEPIREASLRIHGHSYRGEVTVAGNVSPETGMVVDLDVLERAVEVLHEALDHRLLNEIPGLEVPTMENLCAWIWARMAADFLGLVRVSLYRDSSGDTCVYRGPAR